jgi:hypothetical protein
MLISIFNVHFSLCYSRDCDPQTMLVTKTERKQARIKKGRNTSERWRGAAAGGLLGFPARDVRICCSVSGPELRGHAREDNDDSQHPAPPSLPPTAGYKNNQISYTAPAGQVPYHCFLLSTISACISNHEVTIRALNGVNEMPVFRRGNDLV